MKSSEYLSVLVEFVIRQKLKEKLEKKNVS